MIPVTTWRDAEKLVLRNFAAMWPGIRITSDTPGVKNTLTRRDAENIFFEIMVSDMIPGALEG